MKIYIFMFVMLGVIAACSRGDKRVTNSVNNVCFTDKDFVFKYVGTDSVKLDYTIRFDDNDLFRNSFYAEDDSVYKLSKVTLGALSKKAYEISLTIASKDSFPIHYMIQNDTILLCDTVLYYKKIPSYENDSIYAYLASNSQFAKVIRTNYKAYIRSAKKYLVEHDIKADSIVLDKMAKYLYYLYTNKLVMYKNDKEIPIYKQMPSAVETVETNMNADYFYLIGIEKESEVQEFVKREIVDDFSRGKLTVLKGGKKLQLLPINVCGKNYLYLFLCGINKDWSYNCIPVGGVIIDNLAPSFNLNSIGVNNLFFNHSVSERGKFKDCRIDFNNVDEIETNIFAFDWGHFEGDNYFGYSVPFSIRCNASADLDEIIIQGTKVKFKREADLENLRYGFASFRFEHHFRKLNTGDNYIKVVFVDKRGNKSATTINIRMQRIKDNETEINNNIYNNIYN